MSHLTCDRVELSLHVWLENSFSVEPQERASRSGGGHHHRGETIVCEDGMSHSNKSIFIGIHEWLLQVFVFSTGDGRSNWENVLKCVEIYVVCPSSLSPLNKRLRCLWEIQSHHASWCVQRAHIISEPPQCQLFGKQEKWLLLSARCQCMSQVIQRDLKGFHKKNNKQNGTFIWSEHETEDLYMMKFFCAIFDKWNKWRELITVISSKQWTPS